MKITVKKRRVALGDCRDKTIDDELKPWKDEIDVIGKRVIGEAKVTLDRDTCYYAECLLGDFITDAMVDEYKHNPVNKSDKTPYAVIAVTNPGSLRTPINKGNITYEDLLTSQPFENTIDVGELEGKYIKQMLEQCATPFDTNKHYSSLNTLQMSGMHVVYDLGKPEGQRATAKIRCRECEQETYEDLDLNKTYRFITNSFLRLGGDDFKMIRDNIKNVIVGPVDVEVFERYIKENSPIYEELEDRIVVKQAHKIVTRHLHT